MPTQLVSHECSHLGQSKDEHQVEEQLQWCDGGLRLVLAHECGDLIAQATFCYEAPSVPMRMRGELSKG